MQQAEIPGIGMLDVKKYAQLNSIIKTIYKTTGSVSMREELLTQLKNLIDFQFAVFSLGTIKNKVVYLVDNVIISSFDEAFEENFIKMSESQYYTSDYASWIFQIPKSIVYRDSDIVNNELRKETLYYKEYLLPCGLPNAAGVSIVNQKFLGAITLYKSEKSGDFNETDMFILNFLLPHLESRLADDHEKNGSNQKRISYILKNNYNMTAREIEIMGLVFKGNTNVDIAHILTISENTVKKHMTHIYEKLNVLNRSQMIHFIHEHELGDIMIL